VICERPNCPEVHMLWGRMVFNIFNVFQGNNNDAIKNIHNNHASHFIGVHCMVHYTNLTMQTLFELLLGNHLENLLQT
jgi:hypothetical protein